MWTKNKIEKWHVIAAVFALLNIVAVIVYLVKNAKNVKPIGLPHPRSFYESVADQLETAMEGLGTREAVIENYLVSLEPREWAYVYELFDKRRSLQFPQFWKAYTLDYWLKFDLEDTPDLYKRVGEMFKKAGLGW